MMAGFRSFFAKELITGYISTHAEEHPVILAPLAFAW